MYQLKVAETFEFQLRITSIKMKMKFPCRMALQYQKQTITKEASSIDQNKFLFNEVINLRGEGDGFAFQILVSLYTEKGTKYTSGSMKWLSAELLRCKGERLIIPVAKCVDPDAFCELVVEGVKDLKDSQLNLSRQNSKVLNSQQRPDMVSPLPKKIISERYLMGETRSEVNYQAVLGKGSEDKPRQGGPKSQVFKTFTKSPNSKFSTIKYANYNGNNIANNLRSEFPIEQNVQRSNFDETEVYRQGYLKLKEKFKKESELLKEQNRKRAALQANENTLRLEMMKVRVRAEQLEKKLADKNQKVKSLSLQLTDLQKKDLDLAYVRQECSNLQRKNKIQEDTISTLLEDSHALKKLMSQKSALDEKSISALRQELQLARNKADQLGYQFQLQLKAKENIILTKNNDVLLRNDTIQRQKRLIRELQEQAEARMLNFQRSLTAERNTLRLKNDELAAKVISAQSEKSGLCQKNVMFQQEIQKLNATITALEFGKKVLTEEAALKTAQISQLKTVRDKLNELTRQHRFLQQQFTTVRKNLQSSLQNKQINLGQLLKQYQQGRERNDKTKTQQQEKIKFITAKYMQGESAIIVLNNNIEKSKRINDSLTRENNSLREQNKQIREDSKNIEKRFFALENQHSSFSHRNERQNVTLKGLIEKLKEDRSASDKHIDSLQQQIDKLGERVKEFQQKEAQWKIKQRHFQQKIQKQVNKSKESTAKYESIIQDQRHTISESVSSYDSLNSDHLSLKKRTNQLQFAAIRQREASEKLKHSIKLSEERIISLQTQIRHKLDEEKQLKEKITFQQTELAEKEQQMIKFKEKHIQLVTKTAKQDHIVEMLNKDLLRLQKHAEQLTSILKSREESDQKLRNDLKLEKEQVVKQKIKNHKIQSDFQKFKESISDIIRIEFTRMSNAPTNTQKSTDRLRQSQISNPKSERSHRSKEILDAGSLSSNLVQKLHETKSNLWKMVELNRFLKEQNTRLLAHSQSQSNKYQFAQLELHRDIQLLEDEMNNLMSDKQIKCQNYDQLLVKLNFRLKEKETENQDIRLQIAQYEAIVNGLKTDFEANNDLNDKKVASLKQGASELQERIEYLNLNVACLQDKNHQWQQKNIEQENEIIAYKELLIKGEKALLDLRESEAKLLKSEESFKRELKILQQKYVQLQMLCNGEKEGRTKALEILEQEEKKCQKLNDLVNGLIAQKEAAIKSELQKSQQNNQLQNQIFELTHQKDLLQEQAITLKRKLEQSKQQSKSLQKNIKNLQKQLIEQRAKNVRSLQKIKERQSDIQIKKEYIKDLEQKYRQLRDKNYKQIRQLSNQLQDKNLIAINASKELNEKIIKVETESRKRYEQAIALQAEIELITKQFYAERDRVEDLSIQRDRLKEEKMSLDEELVSRQFALQERAQQIKKFQQLVDELRLQVRNLQGQCDAQEKQFNHQIQELSNDYNSKLQETAKENAHNQTILSADTTQAKAKADALEQQLQKVQLQLKTHLEDHAQKMAGWDEKLRRIQNQRMVSIQTKNAEIKKISEDMRALQQQLREKQAQTRRLAIQIQQRKVHENELQGKLTQAAERAKNKQKVLQREIEGLKAREKLALQNKQKLLANLHENETQIRKLISEAVKKLIQICCKADSQKVNTTMKSLQSNVTQAMSGAKLTK